MPPTRLDHGSMAHRTPGKPAVTTSFKDQFDGWPNFIARTVGRAPRPLLVRAIDYAGERGAALDLGSGALNDTRFLLDQGFHNVVAVDLEPGPEHISRTFPPDRFKQVQASFEDFGFEPHTYDLISAQFALPFIGPVHFDRTFDAITASLRQGGVITGQFFGNRDDWVGDQAISFHSEADARTQLSPLSVQILEEEEVDADTAAGDAKHWHIFHFIAIKP